MQISTFNSTEIQITSVYFRNNTSKQCLESYPKRMLMNGHEYTFLESSMRYLVKKGQQLIKLFDVSDGETQYRLRLDNNNCWTLVGMKATN
ncbi:MAG: hypothetical protein NVS1B10_00120 [Candidatus Saccharimonadales bacterium]